MSSHSGDYAEKYTLEFRECNKIHLQLTVFYKQPTKSCFSNDSVTEIYSVRCFAFMSVQHDKL